MTTSSRFLRATAALLTVLIAGFTAPLAAAPAGGDPAPPFRLPALTSGHVLGSDSLLAAGRPTCLILWNTACSDCLADVLAAAERLAACDSLAIIGIVSGEERVGDARRFMRDTDLRFLNLWDATGAVGRAYGIGEESFSAYLIAADRRILLGQVGHPPDRAEFFSRMCALAHEPDGGGSDELEP